MTDPMRGLIKAIIALMLFAALYVPCNGYDVGLEWQKSGPTASTASQSSVKAVRHHANGGESRSVNHCPPDGLFVVFSAQPPDDGVNTVFITASARVFPGQKVSVTQRPPILLT
jgi:hypothetical protein